MSDLGPALGFYLRHFDDAEALRELGEAPKGISQAEWSLVRRVVKFQVDSEVQSLLRAVVRDGLASAIRAAEKFVLSEYGGNQIAKYWSLALSIGNHQDDLERAIFGVAIDGDPDFGPWLGVYLNYSRKPATNLRRARSALEAHEVAFHDPANPDRGWTGQLVVGRVRLVPEATVAECTTSVCTIATSMLQQESWSLIAAQ